MARFLPIADFPGYEVGDDGTIISTIGLARFYRKGRRSMEGGTCGGDGKHRHVTLWRNGRGYSRSVHTIVLETFGGSRPERMQCRHLNGDAADNRLENLAWGTARENSDDARRHGTLPRGERHGCAKITEKDVVEIRRRAIAGEKQMDLGRSFGITQAAVSLIVRREHWGHVEATAG